MNFAELKDVQFDRTDGMMAIDVPLLDDQGIVDRVIQFPCTEKRGPSPVESTEVYRDVGLGEASPVEQETAYNKAYAFWKRHYG